jgi:hypothetical protein
MARPLVLPFPARAQTVALSDRSVLLLLLVVGLVLRLYDLGGPEFSMDELSTLGFAALDPGTLVRATSFDSNMKLYYWLMFLWTRLTGLLSDEGVVRLPSALFGVGAAGLLYLLGRQLFSARVGLAAAALLVSNGYHVAKSQEARSYALYSLLVVGSMLLLDQAVRTRQVRWWLALGVVNGLGMLTHYYVALFILVQGLYLLARRDWRALGLFVLSGLVTTLVAVAQIGPLLRGYGTGASARMDAPNLEELAESVLILSGGTPLTLITTVGLTLLGLLVVRKRLPERWWLLVAWLLVPLLLVFLISQVRPMYKVRYVFGVLPALMLLAGLGLARLPSLASALVVAVLAIQAGGAFGMGEPWQRGERWVDAVDNALERSRPGDGWIFLSKVGQYAFEYYGGWGWGADPDAPYDHIFEPLDWSTFGRFNELRSISSFDALTRFAEQHERIWLIQSHDEYAYQVSGSSDQVRRWFGRNGFDETERRFRRIRVVLYRR